VDIRAGVKTTAAQRSDRVRYARYIQDSTTTADCRTDRNLITGLRLAALCHESFPFIVSRTDLGIELYDLISSGKESDVEVETTRT
jgi:hypothetical protein